ncbi:tyrosine-type recombinase/integrase [Azospirillum brasilense]|uniref:tyrosine-type recombinase/integrase n=1 Tax=Azospirillum brasilense TaxID=192 RepID=UPI001FFF1887|nr:site-specific integrase [Azospirillum brasilense]
MPKTAAGLTARKVATVKVPGMFADGNGLYLQVTATGAKTWIFRYGFAGRRREMGLGSAKTVTLAKARDEAQKKRGLLAEGIDPLEAKAQQEAKQRLAAVRLTSFRECAEAYIKANRPGWSNDKHAAQWESTLAAYAYPVLGDLPVAEIDTTLVLKVLEAIWTTKTETASRVRGRIEAVLDYAKVRGHRTGENPARWKGHLDLILPAKAAVARVEHHPALPYPEMPAFWPKLQAQDGMGARALEFCILTAARSSEVLGARWGEIDIKAKVWTIPANRMKAGSEHRVPLSTPAIALLRKMAAIRTGTSPNDLVFPGQRDARPLSNMAMAMVLRRMTLDATPHGFRSTFRTWVAEQTRFPDAVAEAALAHTIDDKVVAAYQRGTMLEKRRELMEAWAHFCTVVDAKTALLDRRSTKRSAR